MFDFIHNNGNISKSPVIETPSDIIKTQTENEMKQLSNNNLNILIESIRNGTKTYTKDMWKEIILILFRKFQSDPKSEIFIQLFNNCIVIMFYSFL